jgi:hypothetical protein
LAYLGSYFGAPEEGQGLGGWSEKMTLPAVVLEPLSDDKRVGFVRLGGSSQSMEVEKLWQTFQKADGASGRDTPPLPVKKCGNRLNNRPFLRLTCKSLNNSFKILFILLASVND